MISDLDGLLNVANERTCFASCVCAFKSSRLINCLEFTCFCRFEISRI